MNNELIQASECEKFLKPQQLQFQKNATAQLCKILETNSRAFLADEAGLGKTYSAAGVIFNLAKKQWEEQGNGNESPFYALYVAPNRDLLKKNCDDIIDKMERDFFASVEKDGSRLISLTSDLISEKIERKEINTTMLK